MKGFTAYQKYLAIRMHFNPKASYDYFKYNGKTSAKVESFLKDRRNIYKFGGIEKRVGLDELETFFFVNIEENHYIPLLPQLWFKNYKITLSRFESYVQQDQFSKDIKTILSFVQANGIEYDSLFKESKEHLHPMLYVWYDKRIISEFTVFFVDLYINRFIIDESSYDPLQWKEVVEQHQLRRPFYKRCYFSRLQSTDEMVKNWTKAFKTQNLGTH